MNFYMDTVLNLRSELQQSQPDFIQLPSTDDPDILSAVRRLFDALNHQGIRYCHWKSNSRLSWGLAGRTDLDLLIDPGHEQCFKGLLTNQGIKSILAPVEKQYPGLEHYLGFDARTGSLFHLHVHYHLVLGEQYVKNYSLPLEKQFLDSANLRYGVKIPAPELELIVLSLRALLKYRDRDMVKDVLFIRSPGIPAHILNEILWLLGQTSLEQVEQALASLSLAVKPEIILEFLETIRRVPRSGYTLFRLRSRVRKMLRPYQRNNRWLASLKYFKLLGRKMLIQHSAPDRQMTLPNRGLTVALVGVDGAGKSTLCSELAEWLRWKVNTPFYYLGSKQPSLWTSWSYILFRMARRSHREISIRFGDNNLIAKILVNLRQIFLAVHYLFVGHDRFGRYRLAQREASSGSVVIFDRFPFAALFDGPEIHLIDNGRLNSVSRYLAHLEQDLYRKFNPVDLLILLNVSLETSLHRKPGHPQEIIQAKKIALDAVKTRIVEESEKWNWVSIDAEMSLDAVFLHLKKLVWTAL
jgi:thymidylate kinase